MDKASAITEFRRSWKKIVGILDRDNTKAVFSPDQDWVHLFALFVVLVIGFVMWSGYMYLDIRDSVVVSGPKSDTLTETSEAKIRAAAKAISRAEEAFESITKKPPTISDPSK